MSGHSKVSKITIIMVIVAVIITVIALLLISITPSQTVKARVIETDGNSSVCTLDFPSSSCGSYKVRVLTNNDEEASYTVAGFSEGDSKLHDEISSKLSEAEETGKEVYLKINNSNEIISVEDI